jgi:hypothetical protein
VLSKCLNNNIVQSIWNCLAGMTVIVLLVLSQKCMEQREAA